MVEFNANERKAIARMLKVQMDPTTQRWRRVVTDTLMTRSEGPGGDPVSGAWLDSACKKTGTNSWPDLLRWVRENQPDLSPPAPRPDPWLTQRTILRARAQQGG